MWWWHKVRKAQIRADARAEFERYGTPVIAHALAISGQSPGFPGHVVSYVTAHANDATAWLTEKRDIEARHADRIETLEWAILIFLVVGTIVEIASLVKSH